MAQRLARNPLGMIGLFLVLVYGLAVVAISADTLTPTERLPLIYFLIVYPVLVLIAFLWLVHNHSNKLFGPSDFVDEANFMKLQNAEVESAWLAIVGSAPSSRKRMARS